MSFNIRLYQREYYRKNRDRIKQRRSLNKHQYLDKVRKYHQDKRENDREGYNKYHHNYYHKNKGYWKNYYSLNRAKILKQLAEKRRVDKL